jgi:hypothetical protein
VTVLQVRLRASVFALLLAGCSDKEGMPDAGPCWPLPATPGGEVELGTGDIAFEPMPDVLAITKNASQSDPFLPIHSRIRGIPPGNSNDPFDRTNPRTKVSATIADLGLTLGVDCPASIGYVDAPASGSYDLLHSLRIGLGLRPLAEVHGKQAMITVEVVGSNGLYAKAEKLVLLDAPPTM